MLPPGAVMRRREFLGVLGGAATTWPLAVSAQQSERVRRIGVLAGAEDAGAQARLDEFQQSLSLAKPGGNVTGFLQFEYSLAGKWLELLKEIAPDVRRAAVIWDPAITTALGQFAVIQAVAPSLGVELSSVNVRNAPEIEGNVMAFVRSGNGGLVATASALMTHHREKIIALAARNKLPAVYNNRVFVVDGGLISYGVDLADQFRRAAVYVDRILKGEKPADLPVQAPTKYILAINLKTANTLGLNVPPALLARADEVIEYGLMSPNGT